jgi:long-subunit fatty acid transport protein
MVLGLTFGSDNRYYENSSTYALGVNYYFNRFFSPVNRVLHSLIFRNTI